MKGQKTPRHSKQKIICLIIICFLQAHQVFAVPNSFIWLHTSQGQFKIPAIEKRNEISVDILKLAEGLGASTRVSNGIYVMQFSSETIKINPDTNIFSLKELRNSQWKHVRLRDKTVVEDDRLYVTLDSIPVLLNQSFTYHLQRRTLSLGSGPKPVEVAGFTNVPVRYVFRDQKIWISIEDISKALGVLVYSYRADSYSLTLPDFAILELNVGQKTVLRRRQVYKQLDDPVLSFSGSPYATLSSLDTIFEIDVRWDPSSKTVLVPSNFGRLREVQVAAIPKLNVIGYRVEPLRFKLDQFSAYYQEPGPSFASSHNQPYESVRDIETNLPIQRKLDGSDRVSGNAIAEMNGSLANAPFEAKGSMEKVGPDNKLINGGFQWGFPLFHVEGGRQYLTFSGLNNQYQLVDQVSMSHSNDSYGEGKISPTWEVKALYGQHDFDVFASTDYIVQTMIFNQKMAMGSLGSTWKISSNSQWGVKLEQYQFTNEAKQVSAAFENQDLIDQFTPIGSISTVDQTKSEAILRRMASDLV